MILQSLKPHTNLRKFSYSNNDLGPLAVAELIKMIEKRKPYNLDELRL